MTSEFYKDLEIFITGGSGVVGKAAIEKLLRSCDVKKIYILLRCKKCATIEDRLNQMKSSKIFNRLKECKPNELDKLIAIPGDVSLDGLGISTEYREMMKNVSVFFHSAATTRFNEPIRAAIRVNLKSTLESLKIAETLPNLKIFTHVSTFYSNPYLSYIEDKIYPAKFDWRTALKMLDSEYDNMEPTLNAMTEKIIIGFPNTYLFTKHLSEQMVNDYRHKVPVFVYRPSIVVGALEEPEPGFTETKTGVMGLSLIWGTGIIKVLECRPEMIIDLTPLDACTKGLLIYTATTAQLQQEKLKETTHVGMFSSWGLHKYTFRDMMETLTKASIENPYEKAIWIPGAKLTNCPFIFNIYHIFLHLLPSFLIDVLLRLFQQRPFMMYIQRKLFITANVLAFFQKKTYKSSGVTDFKEMLRTEKGTEFDMTVFDNYRSDELVLAAMNESVRGCRKLLMNEDECTLPRARRILKAKIIVYNILRCYVVYAVGCALYPRVMGYFSDETSEH